MQKRTKLILLMLSFSVALLVVFRISQLGRIKVDSALGSSATIQDSDGRTSDYKMGSFLKTGDYMITISGDNGNYSQQVMVPGFLRSTTVAPQQINQLSAQKIANHSGDLQVATREAIYTMKRNNTTSTFRVHQVTNSFPYAINRVVAIPEFFEPYEIIGNNFLGISNYSNDEQAGYALSYFNPVTKSVSKLMGSPLVADVDISSLVYKADAQTGSFVVSYKNKMYFYTTVESAPKIIPLDYSKISRSHNQFVFAYTNNIIAYYSGGTFEPSVYAGENVDINKKLKNEYKVSLFDVSKGQEIVSFSKPSNYLVSDITVSPRGTYVSLSTNQNKLVVIDTKTEESQDLWVETENTEPKWLDDSTLTYLDATTGLREVLVSKKAVGTLYYNPLLNYSSYSVQSDGTIILGGFLKTPDQRIDNGMLLYYLSKSTNLDKLTKYLPYSTLSYSLDTYNGAVYFSALSYGRKDPLYDDPSARSNAIKNRLIEAKKYLDSVGINTNNVVADPDLRSVEEYINP